MKRAVLLIMTFVMTTAMVSCGSTKNLNSDAAAVAAGKSCAKALTGLNKSYKSNGTITVKNSSDLTNLLALATSYQNLKEHKDNASYKQSFANGMIAGSNIFTSANATKFIDKLLNISGLDKLNAGNINQNIETINSIITLLKALK